MRPAVPLGEEDPGLHAAALLFLSDAMTGWSLWRRLGFEFARERFVSPDQATWLHRPPRCSDFWWMASEADLAAGGRVLTRRRILERDDSLLATIAQEALLLSA